MAVVTSYRIRNLKTDKEQMVTAAEWKVMNEKKINVSDPQPIAARFTIVEEFTYDTDVAPSKIPDAIRTASELAAKSALAAGSRKTKGPAAVGRTTDAD